MIILGGIKIEKKTDLFEKRSGSFPKKVVLLTKNRSMVNERSFLKSNLFEEKIFNAIIISL
jgi:hypothetical protein